MKIRFKKIAIALLLGSMIAAQVKAQKVKVAAAGNLRYVLEEIKKEYKKEFPKTSIDITFGSSGTLTQQILNGASFDFFMSADKEFPEKLKANGATIGAIKTYAYGRLVMYGKDVDVSKGLSVILTSAVKKIAIANPVGAPYGEAAVSLLKAQGLYNKVVNKIVWGENIAQAAQFAYTGNAEIGFIALSLAISPEMKESGKYFEIPASLCPPIEQSCVLIKGWERNGEAARFMKFVLSDKCKKLWKEFGYN